MSRMENGNSAMHEYPDKKTGKAGRMEENMEMGDYIGEDGLIYCGVCHEPKQKRFEDSGILAGQVHRAGASCEGRGKTAGRGKSTPCGRTQA